MEQNETERVKGIWTVRNVMTGLSLFAQLCGRRRIAQPDNRNPPKQSLVES